jgi:hypothetical protein
MFDLPAKWIVIPQSDNTICLRNPAAAALSSGSLPKGGAEICVDNLPLPPGPLEGWIRQTLPEASDLTVVPTLSGTKANFAVTLPAGAPCANTALYVAQPDRLYRFVLRRNLGDSAENEMQVVFQTMLDSVRFRATAKSPAPVSV